VRRRQASARAADSANTGRAFEHAAEPLEGKAIQDHPALQSVYDGRERVGHLLRGRQGVEAFDAAIIRLASIPIRRPPLPPSARRGGHDLSS
jgi:hypothetical protein